MQSKMKFKSTLLPLAIILLTALTGGCASITGSTIQSISVQTREQEGKEVPGAACELTNNKGKWFVTSPGSVTVTRSNDDMQVLCNKQGSEPGRASVVSATKGAMFGNILMGGGIGAIVDHNTGAAYEYPAFIQVLMGTFTKIEPPKTPADQPAGSNPSVQPVALQPATAPAVANPSPVVPSPLAPVSSPSPVAASPSSNKYPPNSGSAAQRLRDLDTLYKEGVINEKDFETKKQEILKSM